jgi:error-prone DNA polymerase
MTLGSHPMELMREQLGRDLANSADLDSIGHGKRIRLAGMVVARQRPATAKGVVFMLLEDEAGTINLIVPPPVVERCRVAVRASGFVLAEGRLEHREGTTNLLVSKLERLERGDLPTRPRQIAPPTSRETGREPDGIHEPDKPWRGHEVVSELDRPGREQIVAELVASLPPRHSFGRRG